MNETIVSVAVIEHVGGHGGMDYYDVGLCRGLLAAGCRVSLYTCDETADPGVATLRFRPVYGRLFASRSRWMRAWRFLKGLTVALGNAVVRREKVCHFHFFEHALPELAEVTLARLYGRKIVATVHDVEPLGGNQKTSRHARIYRHVDRLIVHNNASLEELVKLGVDRAKISVIPHGNYLDKVPASINSVEARSALGIRQNAKVALFFGQIKQVKGLDLLIRAIADISREIEEVTLLVAGRPWRVEFSQYDRLIDELGIRDRCVLHLRYIPDSEVHLYYGAADIVVLPYREVYQSGVVLMAMSYGRPVLVSDLPGMTAVVTEGDNGYVFRQGSATSLAQALTRAFQDGQERQRMTEGALEYVRRNHDWNEIGKQTVELYRAVLLLGRAEGWRKTP
ncbi:MAG: glycosyltransferase family 4 protein [Acidobacteriaceae bacterium]